MEDYLEAIYRLQQRYSAARVKDIAHELQVKMPSVSRALKALKARDLVQHEAYGTVTLTAEGRHLAEQVAQRHHVIVDFLTTILGLPPEQAEPEACDLEHALGPATLERLVALTDFLHHSPELEARWHEALAKPLPAAAARVAESKDPSPLHTTLDRLPPGATGRIRRLRGQGPVRRRLLDMGLRAGTEIYVERTAPLGDPIKVQVLDYHLTLRRDEAAGIEIVMIEMPLAIVPAGITVTCFQLACGAGRQRKLEALGIKSGEAFTVVSQSGHQTTLQLSDGRTVGLGPPLSNRVMVRPLSESETAE